MAGIKISALPAASASQLTDIVPAVQTGVTRKETLQQVLDLFNTSIQLGSSAQVTGLDAQLATYLPLAGGTMAGALILVTSSPSTALEAASKGYVDTVASGFTVVLACLGATTVTLNATYANGAAGVGATLTDASGTFAPFAADGLTPALTSRILVKDQTTTFQNGIYSLTTNGDNISIPWVLTRTTDYDQAPSEIHPGTLVAVNTGTANANTSWLETATVTTIGTDPILFSQFTFAPSTFLVKTANLSDVSNVATSRTNLGLGTAAVKAASDAGEAVLASVTGAFTAGNIAVFADTAGTIEDGGMSVNVAFNDFCDGRLTLTSGLPVTVTDVTGATTIFYTSITGDYISLFDGAIWNVRTFPQLSIAVPGTTNTMYDFFIYDNSGTPTPELQTWTNDTTRAVGLVRQNGVLVKSGDATRRFIGSFRTGAVAGQTEDSVLRRWVSNYYNTRQRPMIRQEPTISWNYSVNALRQANGSTANQLDFVVCVSENMVYAQVQATMTSSVVATGNVGIGLDSTTITSASMWSVANVPAGGMAQSPVSVFNNFVPAGRHTLAWLERGFGSGVQTWYSTFTVYMQSGITGYVWS